MSHPMNYARAVEEIEAFRAEVARLTTEAASREAEYSTALAFAQTELAALVAECDRLLAENVRLREAGAFKGIGAMADLLRQRDEYASEAQRIAAELAATRDGMNDYLLAAREETPLAERIKELEAEAAGNRAMFESEVRALATEKAAHELDLRNLNNVIDERNAEKAAHAATESSYRVMCESRDSEHRRANGLEEALFLERTRHAATREELIRSEQLRARATLRAEAAESREAALDRFGVHREWCKTMMTLALDVPLKCSCGLDAALAAVPAPTNLTPDGRTVVNPGKPVRVPALDAPKCDCSEQIGGQCIMCGRSEP